MTKVSKEQNTTVCVGGATLDLKMRVFVCNRRAAARTVAAV